MQTFIVLGNLFFKLQQNAKNKDVEFKCMHGVVGPRSKVEG